jgi:uncharacterized membrane protein
MLLGVFANVASFLTNAGSLILWLCLILPALGMVFLLLGLIRAFRERQVYGGRVAGVIITVLALVFFAFSTLGFFFARALPPSSHAPQVGQKAPDFTLTNTSGESMSLAQLLSTPIDASAGTRPKAVLLVFYRGYW